MCASWHLFDLGVGIRFKHLVIRDDITVLAHILTSGRRCTRYCRGIQTIVFKVKIELFDVVAVATLVKTLGLCTALRHLAVEVSDNAAKYADIAINRYGLVRRPDTMLRVIENGYSSTIKPTPWRLPGLKRLSLGTGLGMVDLLKYRSITTLLLTRPLTFSELDILLIALSDKEAVKHLQTLGLTLDSTVSPRACLYALSRVGCEIEVLSIIQPRVKLTVSASCKMVLYIGLKANDNSI